MERAKTISAKCYEDVPWVDPPEANYRGFHLLYAEIPEMSRDFMRLNFERYAPLADAPSGQKVFVDLGSGRGMVALEMALTPGLERSVAIEITTQRCDRAVIARDNLRAIDPDAAQRLELIEGSFMDGDLSYARWLWCYNTAYPRAMMIELFNKLRAELKPGAIVMLSNSAPAPCLVGFEELKPVTIRIPQQHYPFVSHFTGGHVYRKLVPPAQQP
eukprot:TRINITY_DN28749_c0_g1_i1.p2 TRINITY_DN28749_c0_g1~~TRINITY_DN28749_c0_g1_i1.p2  ORF type:complete len:216 (+),score=64.44 TRINITY_DN28749_c0_g1_i1:245-892(+)